MCGVGHTTYGLTMTDGLWRATCSCGWRSEPSPDLAEQTEALDQHLRVENADTMWTSAYRKGAVLRMPVAHAEGNYEADRDTLDRLDGEGLVLFRYVDADGNVTEEGNPNGSARAIAGIMSAEGNVMGMMPHPDRSIEALVGSVDGRGVFESLVRHLSAAAGAGVA